MTKVGTNSRSLTEAMSDTHTGVDKVYERIVSSPNKPFRASKRSAMEGLLDSKPPRKRTKTGCLTCRKRRIKCGEERPTCFNCHKSSRECEGYSPLIVFRRSHLHSGQPGISLSADPEISNPYLGRVAPSFNCSLKEQELAGWSSVIPKWRSSNGPDPSAGYDTSLEHLPKRQSSSGHDSQLLLTGFRDTECVKTSAHHFDNDLRQLRGVTAAYPPHSRAPQDYTAGVSHISQDETLSVFPESVSYPYHCSYAPLFDPAIEFRKRHHGNTRSLVDIEDNRSLEGESMPNMKEETESITPTCSALCANSLHPRPSSPDKASALRKNEMIDWEYSLDGDDGISTYSGLTSSTDWSFGTGNSKYGDEEERSPSIDIQPSEEANDTNLCWLSSIIEDYVTNITEKLDFRRVENIRRHKNDEVSKDTGIAKDGISDKASTQTSFVQQARKHARDHDEAPNEEDDHKRYPGRRGNKKPQPSAIGQSKLFACFFHKRQPWKFRKTALEDYYKTCPGGYPNVHRLWSDHCRRLHKAPIHCLRCKELFDTQEKLEVHLFKSEPACKVSNEKIVEGINESHKRACAQKVKKCKSEEEKWESIFQVLFPGESVPSPYVEAYHAMSPLAQEMSRFAESYQANDLPRILEQLPSAELPIVRSKVCPAAKRIFQDFIEKFNAKFLESLPDPQSLLRSAELSRIQDENSTVNGQVGSSGESRTLTRELRCSSSPTMGYQENELERTTSSPGEPELLASQLQENTASPACNPRMSDRSTRSPDLTEFNAEIPGFSSPARTPAPDIATTQDSMLSSEYLHVPESGVQPEAFIEGLFSHGLQSPDNDLDFEWMCRIQPWSGQTQKSYQQCNLFKPPTDGQAFGQG